MRLGQSASIANHSSECLFVVSRTTQDVCPPQPPSTDSSCGLREAQLQLTACQKLGDPLDESSLGHHSSPNPLISSFLSSAHKLKFCLRAAVCLSRHPSGALKRICDVKIYLHIFRGLPTRNSSPLHQSPHHVHVRYHAWSMGSRPPSYSGSICIWNHVCLSQPICHPSTPCRGPTCA